MTAARTDAEWLRPRWLTNGGWSLFQPESVRPSVANSSTGWFYLHLAEGRYTGDPAGVYLSLWPYYLRTSSNWSWNYPLLRQALQRRAPGRTLLDLILLHPECPAVVYDFAQVVDWARE